MTQENELLVGALAQAVAQRPLQIPENVDWEKFLALCDAHSVAPLAYGGVQKADLPEKVKKHLEGRFLQATFMSAQFDHLRSALEEKLTEAGIPHIFLKGAELKKDYPVPAMRTMCDLDILVYTKDYPAIDKVAKSLGGTPGHSDGNHRNYGFPGGAGVEFHPNLLHHETPVGTEINPGWQYARGEGSEKALTSEGFYLNTLCHLANHFVAGGVGIRFVLDVWVCRHLRKEQPDRAFVEKELTRFGLLDFARNIEDLAEGWFSGNPMTPELEELGEYILTSGSHGTADRAMLNAVSLSPGGSRSSALLQKAFYSRQEMEDRFPWTKGRPWLQPAAWCVRAFRAVTNHGHLILKWSKDTGKFSQTQIREQKEKLTRFGIRPPKTKQHR